jgi:hypothetical protein
VSVATLEAHGIAAPLPDGFEGRIFVRASTGEEVTYPVAHFATFALPDGVADFGGGAVTLMGVNDIFAVLFEYGPESVGRRLFAREGMPRSLATSDFRPHLLRRGLGGQAGTQWFFTEAGRPFTLYIVLGSQARSAILVPRVNALISHLTISPASPTGVASQPSTPTAVGAGGATPVPSAVPGGGEGARWN